MDRRPLLHEMLTAVAPKVYFQAPTSGQMTYPCIIYKRSGITKTFADNGSYTLRYQYEVTIIDRDPDSVIVDAVAAFPLCSFSSNFVTENLHHDVFTLYF